MYTDEELQDIYRRLLECYKCDYYEYCISNIKTPEEFLDGTCKTKYDIQHCENR